MQPAPENSDIAAVFDHIAEILESQGENPFKIRAYRNAVRTLDGLTEPASAIAARGDLRKIPGFGEAIAAKTQEILSTGTCELYERLKAEADTPQSPAERAEVDIKEQQREIGESLGARDPESQVTLGQEEEEEDLPSPW